MPFLTRLQRNTGDEVVCPFFFNPKIGGILNHQKGAFVNESLEPESRSSKPLASREERCHLFDNARPIVYTLGESALSI